MDAPVTQWFPPEKMPEHPGPYQTCENMYQAEHWRIHGFQHWNGAYWGTFNTTAEAAIAEAHMKSIYQFNYWRGLAVKP